MFSASYKKYIKQIEIGKIIIYKNLKIKVNIDINSLNHLHDNSMNSCCLPVIGNFSLAKHSGCLKEYLIIYLAVTVDLTDVGAVKACVRLFCFSGYSYDDARL